LKALDDITVLACEQFEAGTTATELLAFLGAEVIMVEAPMRGQPGRTIMPTYQKGVDTFYHIYLNLNKKSITLNLTNPKGVGIFKEMAKKADIVFDNLGPGTMDRLGIGYEALKAVNPRLIVTTLKGFGEGPYSDYLCYDNIAQATGGAYTLSGWPDKPPTLPGTTLGDTGSGMHGFVAMLAALHYRDITGEGQFVELAMVDNSLCFDRVPLALRQAEKDPMFTGAPAKRVGNDMAGAAPHGIYKAKDTAGTDNYVAIHVVDQAQWHALLKVLGKEDLLGDERFKDSASRWENREAVNQMVEAWTSQRSAQNAFHTLAQAGVPAGVTQNIPQVMNDPHLIARRSVVEVDHPHRGKFKALGCAPRLADSPVEVKCAPLLGQNNADVYARLMGYTQYELAELAKEGII